MRGEKGIVVLTFEQQPPNIRQTIAQTATHCDNSPLTIETTLEGRKESSIVSTPEVSSSPAVVSSLNCCRAPLFRWVRRAVILGNGGRVESSC